MKTHTHTNTAGFAPVFIFVIIMVVVGVASFFVVRNMGARGTQEVAATVRVADGMTEDELFISPASVTRKVSAKAVALNETEYHLQTVAVSDSATVTFDNCVLTGTYEPVRCTTTNGTAYWITLTEIE